MKSELYMVVGACYICGGKLLKKIPIIFEEDIYWDTIEEHPIAWVCSKECEDTFKIEELFNDEK